MSSSRGRKLFIFWGRSCGVLKIFDLRASTLLSLWGLHEERINTIHCKPDDPNIVVTSLVARTFSVWDLRSISRDQPKSLTTIRHGGPIHSACFTPFGSFLATTSSYVGNFKFNTAWKILLVYLEEKTMRRSS